MKKYLLLALTAITMSACTDTSSNPNPDPNSKDTTKTSSNLMIPLKVGNEWVYFEEKASKEIKWRVHSEHPMVKWNNLDKSKPKGVGDSIAVLKTYMMSNYYGYGLDADNNIWAGVPPLLDTVNPSSVTRYFKIFANPTEGQRDTGFYKYQWHYVDTLTVPAGKFTGVWQMLVPTGGEQYWFKKGVGVIRFANTATGSNMELTKYTLQ